MDSTSKDVTIDTVAYDTKDHPDRGYWARASYLKAPDEQKAQIEIFQHDGQLVRSFLYPAYRIYNIAAHFSEIVDDIIEEPFEVEQTGESE